MGLIEDCLATANNLTSCKAPWCPGEVNETSESTYWYNHDELCMLQGKQNVYWNNCPLLVLCILRLDFFNGWGWGIQQAWNILLKNVYFLFFIYIYIRHCFIIWICFDNDFVFLVLITNSPFQPLFIISETLHKISEYQQDKQLHTIL